MTKKKLLEYIRNRVEAEEIKIRELKESTEFHKGMNVQLKDMYTLIENLNKKEE